MRVTLEPISLREEIARDLNLTVEQVKMSTFSAKLREVAGGLREVIVYEDGTPHSFAGNADETSEKAIVGGIVACQNRLRLAQEKLIRAQAEVTQARQILEVVQKLPYDGKVEAQAPRGWDRV